jgi:TolB-like protein/cytochrome c-type biogenesis protein CcmH/NrfG
MSFFGELKRRNVFRMGIAYVVVAWVLLQAIDFTLDIISAPNWVMQVFFLAGVAGLPVVLIFAWVFEMTPEGIKRESEVDRAQSITHGTGRKLDRTIIAFLALAVALLLAERFMGREKGIEPEPEIAAKEMQPTSTPVQPQQRSVAVLPFVNMSSDPEQEYFSDGLSEELLNRLAKNDLLRVAARTSSFQFKGQNQDVSEIGRQLKVEHILEGSVRKSANRLRITAQLIQVDSGFHLWSETYEREINDIFAIQDDISLAITRALEAELGASPKTDDYPTDNLAAYQLYLEARFLLAKRGEANMLKAQELFEQTVGLDPTFSEAWSGLAYNLSLLPQYGTAVKPNEAWEKVKIAAEQAIHHDPNNAEAYVAFGRINTRDEFSEIKKLYEKAYELAPNSADVLNFYADFMMQIGNFESAERFERKAVELDPLAAVHYSDLAFVMFSRGRYEEGLEYGRTSARLEPDTIDRLDPLVVGLIATGRYEEASQLITRTEQQGDSNLYWINWWKCLLYYYLDDRQNLRKIVTADNSELEFTHMAFFTTWLDGVEAALPLLAKAYEKGEYLLFWPEYFYLPEYFSNDPKWLAFWSQPRLAGLMEMRRNNQTQEQIGWWKGGPGQ